MGILQAKIASHGLKMRKIKELSDKELNQIVAQNLETINLIKNLIIYKRGGEKAKQLINSLGNGSGLLAQGNGKSKRADCKGQPAPKTHIKDKFFSAGCQVVGKRSLK